VGGGICEGRRRGVTGQQGGGGVKGVKGGLISLLNLFTTRGRYDAKKKEKRRSISKGKVGAPAGPIKRSR